MLKRRLFWELVPVVLLVAVIGVGILRSPQTPEPAYRGRKLSQWVLELPLNASWDGESAAENAIRQIGTNSLPYLVAWIGYEPPSWRLKLYEGAGKFLRRGPNTLFQDKGMLRAAGCVKAFQALAQRAEPARIELCRIAADPRRRLSKVYSGFAYSCLPTGPQNVRFPADSATAFSGVDAFSLNYQTNGMPILTVSHTNAIVGRPTMLHGPGNAPPLGRTFRKSE